MNEAPAHVDVTRRAQHRSGLSEMGSRGLSTGLWLGAALALSVVLGAVHSPLVPLPGVVTLLIIPGASIMATLRTRPANVAARVVLGVCLSMMFVMVVGGVISLLGPHVGIAHPLDPESQRYVWAFIGVGILALSVVSRRDPVTWMFEGVRAPSLVAMLTSGVLVVISILGVAQLNHTGNSRLAIVGTVLDAAVLVTGIAGGWRRDSKWSLTTLLYGATLALLLSTSLRGGHLFGWDVQQEFGVALNTVQAGVWRIPANHDPYASMLSLTVLPAILQSLVKLRLLAFFQLVVPAILALLPVAIFVSVRSVPRWVTSGRVAPRPGLALAVVSGIIVSSVAFSSDLVSITRQAMATTMLAALVMVMLDRTMTKRSSQVVIGLLIIEISFTHYTTSYLLAAVLLCAWFVCLVWDRGSFIVPRSEIEQHRKSVESRRILNGALVILSLAAAFGWNIGITRNYALSAPSGAVATKGVGLGGTTLSALVSPTQLENLLVHELSQSAKYIVPVPGARLVHLIAATTPTTKGVLPSLATFWNKLDFIATEGIWLILGVALLYGVARLGRRRQYAYSSDLIGLGVTGLLFGGLLRSSGTLSSFYNPERAAIITAILLATPATIFLDDLVSRRPSANRARNLWLGGLSLAAVVAYVSVLVVGATGLSALLIGGNAPGSLSRGDVNVDNFTVSSSEFATAQWLRARVTSPNIVQADLHGQLVLLSEPGSYDLINEIVPPEVDKGAYVYLSKVNLAGNVSQASADDGNYATVYRSTVQFFDQHFYVVYSTGGTRVYH
jgi:uncharacterized membrane protein